LSDKKDHEEEAQKEKARAFSRCDGLRHQSFSPGEAGFIPKKKLPMIFKV
jgi:hypothetical protein